MSSLPINSASVTQPLPPANAPSQPTQQSVSAPQQAPSASPFNLNGAPTASVSSNKLAPTNQAQQIKQGFSKMAQTALSGVVSQRDKTAQEIGSLLKPSGPTSSTSSQPALNTQLRKAVPRPTDPLLSKIVEQEKEVMTHQADLSPHGYLKQKYQVHSAHSPPEEFIVWEAHSDQKRVVMDNGPFKIEHILLPILQKPNPSREWKDWTTNVKTCTSVLSNQEASFCGNYGVLVYLAPDNESALISAAPHDVLSPSEMNLTSTTDPIKYKRAKDTVHIYVQNQENLKIAHDFVEEIISDLEKSTHLTLSDTKRLAELKNLSAASTFDKTYYVQQVPITKIQKQIELLKEMLVANTALEQELGLEVSDLSALENNINNFLKDTNVLKRGTQRIDTTNWQLSAAADEHVLHPEQRARNQTIQSLYQELKKVGALQSTLSGPGEAMTDQEMQDFLKYETDRLFQNIFLNTLENYTATRAVEVLSQKKANQEFVAILTELEQLLNDPSTSASIRGKAEGLKKAIKAEQEYSKGLYSEMQMHSNQLKVSGLGIKKTIMEILKRPELPKIVQEYHNISQNIATNHQKTAYEALAQKNGFLDNNRLPDVNMLQTVVQTYKLVQEAKAADIPLFLHKGSP